jgi:hypothetical protein
MCTGLLPPGVNPMAVKYIIFVHTSSCILLQQLRETLKRETSKKGIRLISKQELIAKHLKQFLKFANSIDFDNL